MTELVARICCCILALYCNLQDTTIWGLSALAWHNRLIPPTPPECGRKKKPSHHKCLNFIQERYKTRLQCNSITILDFFLCDIYKYVFDFETVYCLISKLKKLIKFDSLNKKSRTLWLLILSSKYLRDSIHFDNCNSSKYHLKNFSWTLDSRLH